MSDAYRARADWGARIPARVPGRDYHVNGSFSFLSDNMVSEGFEMACTTPTTKTKVDRIQWLFCGFRGELFARPISLLKCVCIDIV